MIISSDLLDVGLFKDLHLTFLSAKVKYMFTKCGVGRHVQIAPDGFATVTKFNVFVMQLGIFNQQPFLFSWKSYIGTE